MNSREFNKLAARMVNHIADSRTRSDGQLSFYHVSRAVERFRVRRAILLKLGDGTPALRPVLSDNIPSLIWNKPAEQPHITPPHNGRPEHPEPREELYNNEFLTTITRVVKHIADDRLRDDRPTDGSEYDRRIAAIADARRRLLHQLGRNHPEVRKLIPTNAGVQWTDPDEPVLIGEIPRKRTTSMSTASFIAIEVEGVSGVHCAYDGYPQGPYGVGTYTPSPLSEPTQDTGTALPR